MRREAHAAFGKERNHDVGSSGTAGVVDDQRRHPSSRAMGEEFGRPRRAGAAADLPPALVAAEEIAGALDIREVGGVAIAQHPHRAHSASTQHATRSHGRGRRESRNGRAALEKVDDRRRTPNIRSMDKGDLTKAGSSDVTRFLGRLQRTPPPQGRERRGRLMFALDATASREPSWDRATRLQGEMFLATEGLGGLEVQLVYFRGFDECRASRWVSEPRALVALMTKVTCRAGQTQIERVLRHAVATAKDGVLDALVYVGDACEEEIDRLGRLAGELGARGVRAFLFQEGQQETATRAFRHLAELTGGAHCQLSAASPDELRQLLRAVAAYAAGGRAALDAVNRAQGAQLRLLGKG